MTLSSFSGVDILESLHVWVCLSSGKLKQLWSHTHLFKGDYFLTPRGSSSETTDEKSLFFFKKSLFPFKGSTIRQLLLFRCLVWFLVTKSDRNVVKATEMTLTLDTLILLLQNSWASSEPPVPFRPPLLLHTWFSAGEFRNSLHDHVWGLSFCVVFQSWLDAAAKTTSDL